MNIVPLTPKMGLEEVVTTCCLIFLVTSTIAYWWSELMRIGAVIVITKKDSKVTHGLEFADEIHFTRYGECYHLFSNCPTLRNSREKSVLRICSACQQAAVAHRGSKDASQGNPWLRPSQDHGFVQSRCQQQDRSQPTVR